MSSGAYLLFSQRGHKSPCTLLGHLNPHPCLQLRRFTVPRYAKCSDVAPYAIDSFFLLPTPSAPHCTLKVSKHDSLWQPPAAHPDEHPPPTKKSLLLFTVGCLCALTSGYLEGAVVEIHLMNCSFALCPDNERGPLRQVPPLV